MNVTFAACISTLETFIGFNVEVRKKGFHCISTLELYKQKIFLK